MGPNKREDILGAALVLFAQKGFHGTSVPDIARSAGVGAGTIYRYFDSKEGLVNSLYQLWKQRLAAQVYGGLPREGSWRQRFRTLWRELVAFAKDNPEAMAFLDQHYHGDYLDEQSKQVELASAALLFGLVLEGQQDEVLVDLNPAAVVALVYGAFSGLIRGAHEGHYPLDEPLIAQAEERVWALIRH